jgi:hypothetical protein
MVYFTRCPQQLPFEQLAAEFQLDRCIGPASYGQTSWTF